MSYEKLDEFITGLDKPKDIPFGAASVGLIALKKLAAGVCEPERRVVPLEAVRNTLAEIVTCEFQKQASGFPNQLRYFVPQLNKLGGATVPQLEKVAGVLGRIALEERSLVLKEKLCHLLGSDSPAYPTLRSFIADDQRLLGVLQESRQEAAMKTAGMKLAERAKKSGFLKRAQPVVVPPPNVDTAGDYVARERQLAYDQAMQELAHTKMQLNQTSMVAQQAQQEGQQAQEQLAQTGQQLEEAQAMALQSDQQAQAAQQQSVEAEGRAAEHATQKMQLGIRVQQMRQALAEIASQDPVTETASSVNDLAAQGAPATPDQIQQAGQEQAAAEEQAAAGPPTAKKKEQVEQADRASQEAEQQQAQAQQAVGPAAAPAAPATTPAGMAAA